MPAAASERKAALRRAVRALPAADFTPLLAEFLRLPEVRRAESLLLFCGVGREPDTTGLIDTLLEQGKEVALPLCLPGHRMEARRIASRAELVPGAYGIPEPAPDCPAVPKQALDVILVPNLCCDRQGYRLGHGGGYYDRYLKDFSGFTAALCPREWLQEQVPREPFDRPVQRVITGD